jgi:acylphosphatase
LPEKTARRYWISGIVQGVGFRFFASRLAARLGIAGFVKNLDDGRVEVYAIGPAEALQSFRSGLESGPSGSSVDTVSEEPAPVEPRFSRSFTIERQNW